MLLLWVNGVADQLQIMTLCDIAAHYHAATIVNEVLTPKRSSTRFEEVDLYSNVALIHDRVSWAKNTESKLELPIAFRHWQQGARFMVVPHE